MKQQEAAITTNIFVQVWDWTGTATSGAMLAQSVKVGGDISGTMTEYQFDLDTPFTMTPAADYAVCFSSEVPQASGYIRIGGDQDEVEPTAWGKDSSPTLADIAQQVNIALWTLEEATPTSTTTDLGNLPAEIELFLVMLTYLLFGVLAYKLSDQIV